MRKRLWYATMIIVGVIAAALLAARQPGVRAQSESHTPAGPMAAPVTSAFTYQGYLKDGGAPANGTYDFQFKLYDAVSGGLQIGSTLTKGDIVVSEGVFSVSLDFGAGAFAGDARWLLTSVRPGSSTGAYTALTPRQALTATPYALSLQPGAVINGSAPNGILNVNNTDGTGLYVDFVEDDGVYIESAGSNGVVITSAGLAGVYVGSAEHSGVDVSSAGNDGVYVGSADDDGVDVSSAGDDGVSVYSAVDDGFFVAKTGSASAYGGSSDHNGVEIGNTQGHGVYVNTAGSTGLYVNSAGGSGLYVGSGYNGVNVNSASNDGVYVSSAVDDGFFVAKTGSASAYGGSGDHNGVEIGNVQHNGVYVNSAGGDGVWVDSTVDDGMQVSSAGHDGVYVISANDDGVDVISADHMGVYADTTSGVYEWGVYTPDKIFADQGYVQAGPLVVLAQVDGTKAITAGDLVAVTGVTPGPTEGGAAWPTVQRATAANRGAIIGVATGKMAYLVDERSRGENDEPDPPSLHSVEGAAAPGEYVGIVVLGVAQVNATPGEVIQAGERLTLDAVSGALRPLRSTLVNGLEVGESAPVIGVALSASDGTAATVYVFVSYR